MIFSSPVPQKACTSSPSSMHQEPEGLEVDAFCEPGGENIMPTFREAGN